MVVIECGNAIARAIPAVPGGLGRENGRVAVPATGCPARSPTKRTSHPRAGQFSPYAGGMISSVLRTQP